MRANTRVVDSRSRAPKRAARARVTARKEPRQERSRALVESVLAAAARVLIRDGYEAATTNRIAEVAGVSVGSLYQYFPGKEAIVSALAERHAEQMWSAFVTGTGQAWTLPVTAAVPQVIAALWACHGIDPRLHRVLHEQVPRLGQVDRMREINRRASEVAEQFLAAHAAELRVRDIKLAAFVVVELVEAMIHASLHAPQLDGEALRAETCTAVLRYLGA